MEKAAEKKVREARVRVALAVTISVVAGAYTMGVLAGWIPANRQISATHLGVLVVAAIAIVLVLRPEALERITNLEMAGVKLQLQKQAERVDELYRILPVLLPQKERDLLMQLASGPTAGEKGREGLKDRLRRLRSVGLIGMKDNHRLRDLTVGETLDLADYVELTELGTWWAERSRELAAAEEAEKVRAGIP